MTRDETSSTQPDRVQGRAGGDVSERAAEACERAYMEAYPEVTISTTPRALLRIAHDPALGLDRSVCLRDVVAFLYGAGESEHADELAEALGVSVPDHFAHEFGAES